jgi:hypothetical protein
MGSLQRSCAYNFAIREDYKSENELILKYSEKNGNLSYDISYAIFLQAQTASLLPTEILL